MRNYLLGAVAACALIAPAVAGERYSAPLTAADGVPMIGDVCRALYDHYQITPPHPCDDVPIVVDRHPTNDFATRRDDRGLVIVISQYWWNDFKKGTIPANDMAMAILHEMGHVVCDGGIPASSPAGQKQHELRADAFAAAAYYQLHHDEPDGDLETLNAIAQAGYDLMLFGADTREHPAPGWRVVAMAFAASRPGPALACRGEESFLLEARK